MRQLPSGEKVDNRLASFKKLFFASDLKPMHTRIIIPHCFMHQGVMHHNNAAMPESGLMLEV
jgi:hypothetical protein